MPNNLIWGVTVQATEKLRLRDVIVTDFSDDATSGSMSHTKLITEYAAKMFLGGHGYITEITSAMVIAALGYTPYSTSNPAGYITASALSGFATTAALASGLATKQNNLGFTPYNASNPAGYISVITGPMVTGALGFTPYNATNPAGYITTSALAGFATIAALTTGLATKQEIIGFTPYNASNPSGYISGITGTMVTGALGYTPYNATNPSGYISGINGAMVTTALGFTPYSAANPSGYITSAALMFTAVGQNTYYNLTGNIGIGGTTAPTHGLTFGSGSSGYAQYNTADQTTNYERVRGYWTGNTYTIKVEAGGTGLLRNMQIGTLSFATNGAVSNNGSISATAFSSTGSAQPLLLSYGNNPTLSAGQSMSITMIGNCTQSGTASYTGTRFTTCFNTVGSGQNLILEAGTNTAYNANGTFTQRFSIDLNGNAYISGTVGVGNATPAVSAILDLTSTTKGFLAPRMTTTQRDAIASPATGLLFYNSTLAGFNFYNGSAWAQVGAALPNTPNKVITTNSAGAAQAVNDLVDYLSTTSEATLLAQDWTSGSVTATGLAGQEVYGSTYQFKCTGTNTWRRTPYNLIVYDYYLANVSDSAAVKTSTQMATLYPAAVQGQRARGANGVYEYFGLFGWVYFPFTII